MARAKLNNGIELEYEIEGDLKNPVLLVILGITDNITDWPEGLYLPLVEAGYCVVRYELRDMGLSTHFDSFGMPDLKDAAELLAGDELPVAPYTVYDMAEDARLLLAELDLKKASVLGYSYGAYVAQRLVLDAPEMFTGLVCLQGSNYNPSLPPRTKEVEQAMFAAIGEYVSIEDQVNAIYKLRQATNGSAYYLDEKEAMTSAQNSVARTYYPQGTARIVLSRLATPLFFEETAQINCPTLILHADEDPIFDIQHGYDMSERIPNSRLRILEGAGHNHPLSLQPIISEALIEFMGSFSFQ